MVSRIDKNMKDFQRTTFGAVRQFDVMTCDFIQILHINNNYWVCITYVDCKTGYVIVLNSLMLPISKEVQELAESLVGETFKGVHNIISTYQAARTPGNRGANPTFFRGVYVRGTEFL